MTGSLTNVPIRKLDDRGILVEFQQDDPYSNQNISWPWYSYEIKEFFKNQITTEFLIIFLLEFDQNSGEDFFRRNSLFTLELTCLSKFWFLSRSWGKERKEVEFSILRSAIASTSHLKIPHLPKFRHFCMNKERIPFIAIEQKSVSQALCT